MELRIYQKYIGLINLKHKLSNSIKNFDKMTETEAIKINNSLLRELSILSVIR